MSFIYYDPEYVPYKPNPVELLCSRANGVLGSYMLPGTEIESDDTLDEFSPDSVTLGLDDPEDETELPVVHKTHIIEINDRQGIHLSNRPFLIDNAGLLHPYTRPGFVALHIMPLGLETKEIPKASDCDQVIFRMPHTEEEAAIFRGFSFDEDNLLHFLSREVNALKSVITYMGWGLTNGMMNQPGFWAETYFAQTPEPTIEAILKVRLEDE